MKTNNMYWTRIVLLLIWSTIVAGCSEDTNEPLAPSTPTEDKGVIMITTREISDSPEDAIRTFRLFLFAESQDGSTSLVLNKLFNTADASILRPEGFRSFFVKEVKAGKVRYTISEMLKKETIKIMMVANEADDMSGINTVEGVRQHLLNFHTLYTNAEGLMDIRIDASEINSNKGYIPMFAELPSLTEYKWNAINGGTIELPLTRLLAKIVLNLKKTNIVSKDVTLKSASMTQVPSSQFVSNQDKYSSDLVTVPSQALTITDQSQTDQAVFYIPEYLLSEISKQKGLYTYIQLNAQTNVGGKEVNSVYKIPIGNGIKDGMNLSDATIIEKLTAEELSILRNTVYTLEPNIVSTGTLQVFKVNVKIEDWTAQEISGDVDPPCLVISTLEWQYNHDLNVPNRIYFWTNVEKPKLENTVVINDRNGGGSATELISTVFKDLLFTEGSLPANFHLFETESIQYPYNGYFDLEIQDTYKNKEYSFNLKFNAGGLKRTIRITTPTVLNP